MVEIFEEQNGKKVLKLDSVVLEKISEGYDRFYHSLQKTKSAFLTIKELDDETLFFFVIKNYIFAINDLKTDEEKSVDYFSRLDNFCFYYSRTIYDYDEMVSGRKIEGVLDDIEQFLEIVYKNGNRTILEMLAHLSLDYMIEKSKNK